VITATILAAGATAAIGSTATWPLIAAATLVGIIGLLELYSLRSRSYSRFGLGAATAGISLVAAALIAAPLGFLVPWFVGVAGLLLATARPKDSLGLGMATGWVIAPLIAGVWLHQATAGPAWGMNLLWVAIVPLWFGDTAAYLVGKAVGRTPLAPKLSPKKTWEGAIANLGGCVMSAVILGSTVGIPPASAALVGVVLGIAGQVGDLLQSAVKRAVDVKDSGFILPGHGGVLDRLDSFFFAGLLAILMLSQMVPHLFHVKP
jgi:phosphatidate cytidylyltransferase